MSQSEQRRSRQDVPIEQTWDVTDLFKNEEEWEKEAKKVQEDIQQIVTFKGRLHQNAMTLLQALQEYEQYQQRLIHLMTYANLLLTTDGTDPAHQGRMAKISAILANIGAKLAFFETELIDLPKETFEKFMNEEKELRLYQKLITDLFAKKPYILAPEVEETIAALGETLDAPFMIYERSKTSDMQFDSIQDKNGHELPMSEVLYENKYEFSADTTIRRNAYDSFMTTFNQYKNTYAATYATEVTKEITMARLRGYDSVIDMLLEPHDVTKEMYENQLNIIQEELAPHMRRLARLKQQDYQLNELRFCDLKAPLDPSYAPETTYKEARILILDALQVMGSEYTSIMEKAFDERWIDYADNIGKQSGAYCTTPYGAHPYILTSWTDMMPGAFTLAHELGHAGHFYLAGNHQHLVNTSTSTYFVEAPSTLNELLLGSHLIEQTDNPRLKRWVINQLLDTYYHNFVTHLLEGEFQRRVYRLAEAGTALTADVLCAQKQETIINFWGDAAVIDERAGLTWMRQPHYYMGLYPYTYSAGLTIATAVFDKINREGQPAVEQWIEVLKTGGSISPLALSKKAGVDMSTPDAIRTAIEYVGSLVDELEESYQ